MKFVAEVEQLAEDGFEVSFSEKKGFTLIELMVVIVIIGILAAIAIPKLFGLSAKAKASEVGPAAGTWSKLQQAYMVESFTFGSWVSIAYKAPGVSVSSILSTTSNFTYNDLTADATNAYWNAQSGNIGGGCNGGVWTAGVNKDGDAVGTAPANNAECSQLTPNFDKLR